MRKIIKDKVLVLDKNNEPNSLYDKEYYDNNLKVRTRYLNRKKRKYKNPNSSDANKGSYRSKIRSKQLRKRAKNLERLLPKSEAWFRKKYHKEGIERLFKGEQFQDAYNKPYSSVYIPDVINEGYKYIIEIDGSIHDDPEVQFKDAQKDYYFSKRGFLVLRIRAYDNDSYNEAIIKLKAHIETIDAVERKAREERIKAAMSRNNKG
jgi:very-short-patch-repair endonuclease